MKIGQESMDVARSDPAFRGCLQQSHYARPFVHKFADVPLRLGQCQGALEGHECSPHVAAHVVRERLEHQYLDHASRPTTIFRRLEEPVQES